MDESTQAYLRYHSHLKTFIRHNPEWYRYLSRDPSIIVNIEKAAKQFYGKTFTQRLEKFHEQIHLVEMFLSFSDIMKD